ncbi:MAG TPA: hypothetical protein VGO62_19335, partial [Myxococcota bacterium]
NRDTLAIMLSRMYALPAATHDYFSDDNGSANEDWHNKVAEAGLFTGFDDGHGGRKFEGANAATKTMLATLATRAQDASLVPVWLQRSLTPPPVGDDNDAAGSNGVDASDDAVLGDDPEPNDDVSADDPDDE